LRQYAGLEKSEGRKVMASFKDRFASMSDAALLEFANAVMGKTYRKMSAQYNTGNQKTVEGLDVERGTRHFGGELDLNRKAKTPTVTDFNEFKTRLKADKGPERLARDLRYYAKRAGGKKVMGMMSARFTPEVVANVYFPNQAASSSIRNATDRQGQKDSIVNTLIDPDFTPMGVESALIPEFFEVQVGRWLRDEIAGGASGSTLSKKIASSLTREEILAHAPLILAMREEEGLLGRAYLRADAFDDCRVGSKAARASARDVVKAAKCGGCVYNRGGSCLRYSRPLTAAPKYDQDTFKKALAHRIAAGQLTRDDAELLVDLNHSAKELTRKAHTVLPQTHTHVAENRYQGHYGDAIEQGKTEKRIVAMLQKARVLILEGQSKSAMISSLNDEFGTATVKLGSVHLNQVYERTTSSISDHVDATHINAPTGLSQMDSLEMTASQVSNPFDNLDLGEVKTEQNVDITFGGHTE
jgi:hypothetical protein